MAQAVSYVVRSGCGKPHVSKVRHESGIIYVIKLTYADLDVKSAGLSISGTVDVSSLYPHLQSRDITNSLMFPRFLFPSLPQST